MQHSQDDQWSLQQATELYQFDRWSNGFYGVSDYGTVEVYPNRDRNDAIDLHDLASIVEEQGCQTPALFRFPQIIQQRARDLQNAFDRCISEYNYQGDYTCIYPVKVCPHIDVIQSFGGPPGSDAAGSGKEPSIQVGLEAGSKAELLAVIATSDRERPILCNGFKDQQFVEMALNAIRLGRRVTIIIEKPTEFELVHRAVQRIGIKPSLGVRMKLSSRGVGHWESSGGTKSKFGLTISELLHGIKQLEDWSLADALEVVHFHLGSQITEIRFLKRAVTEATRIYSDLYLRGLPVRVIDVGGGLGIDYCGKRMSSKSSINYSQQEYANDVVYHIQSACDQAGVPHPRIYSESGRALVAHHSVLVIPILGQTGNDNIAAENLDLEGFKQASPPVHDLRDTLKELADRNLLESYHDAEQAMEMAGNMFRHGHLSLQERGDAEILFQTICQSICDRLSNLRIVPEELKSLDDLLAVNNFANFSVFRSLPDHWAIQQLFPITPIHRLDERPTRPSVISDITCDSDGRIKSFVGPDGESPSLYLHARNEDSYYLGVFLVGAYQEILGDTHNLFGLPNVVNVSLKDGEIRVSTHAGDSMTEVLDAVGFTREKLDSAMNRAISGAVESGLIDQTESTAIADFYRDVATGYTYLDPDQPESSLAPPHWVQREASAPTDGAG